MATTKIFVLHIRQIINFSAVMILILAIIITSIFLKRKKTLKIHDIKEEKSSSFYIPGDYFSQIILYKKPIQIKVSVNKNKILAIDLNHLNYAQQTFYPLLKPTIKKLAHEIITHQSLNIIPQKNQTVTQKILLLAINQALKQAELY